MRAAHTATHDAQSSPGPGHPGRSVCASGGPEATDDEEAAPRLAALAARSSRLLQTLRQGLGSGRPAAASLPGRHASGAADAACEEARREQLRRLAELGWGLLATRGVRVAACMFSWRQRGWLRRVVCAWHTSSSAAHLFRHLCLSFRRRAVQALAAALLRTWNIRGRYTRWLRAVANKVTLRRQLAAVREALATWKPYTVAEARRRNLLARTVQRMQQRCSVLALDLWHAHVLGAIQERADEARRSVFVQRVIGRMMHAALASGFGRWCDNARELHRQRGVIGRVVLRMKTTGMCAALQRWREALREQKAVYSKGQRVVLRWKLQAVVWCLEAWRELMAEEARKRNLMRRIVARMLRRSLSLAMGLWQGGVSAALQKRAEEERRQDVMSRIVRRMLNQAQAAAFGLWTANTCELCRQRNIMDRKLRRMFNARLVAGEPAVGVLAVCPSGQFTRPESMRPGCA